MKIAIIHLNHNFNFSPSVLNFYRIITYLYFYILTVLSIFAICLAFSQNLFFARRS